MSSQEEDFAKLKQLVKNFNMEQILPYLQDKNTRKARLIGLHEYEKTIPQSHSFEEAITLTKTGRFHYRLIFICGMCFMSVMVEIMGVSVIMPSMKCDLTSTVSEQGFLASAGFLGVVLSSHAMGFLADTWGRVKTLKLALALGALATIISAFSVNIWMLITFRFLNGFFISGCQACVFSLCGEFHGNKTRVRHVTLLSGFLPLALVYLPTIAIGILPLQINVFIFGLKLSPWRILLLVNSSLSLIAFCGLTTLPETPKYILVQGKHDEALEILRWIYSINTGRSPDEYPVRRIDLEHGGASLTDINGFKSAVRMIWYQTIPLFYKERYLHTLNICLTMFTIYGIAQGLFMWFPTILNELLVQAGRGFEICQIIGNMDTTISQANDVCDGNVDRFMFIVLIIIGASFTVFYLIFAFTIDIIGKKNLLIGWLIISTLCIVAVHWITDFSLAVIALTLTMSVGNCGGLVSTLALEFYPTNINAMGMCFIMMVGRLGAVAGSNIIGQTLFASCDKVFWVLLGLLCMLCVMGSLLPERKHPKLIKPIT